MASKLKQMREIVLKELEYISEGPLPQGELRQIYWTKRMHSLGKKATTKQTNKEVLESCIEYLKKDYPGFEFEYDEFFFNQQ